MMVRATIFKGKMTIEEKPEKPVMIGVDDTTRYRLKEIVCKERCTIKEFVSALVLLAYTAQKHEEDEGVGKFFKDVMKDIRDTIEQDRNKPF